MRSWIHLNITKKELFLNQLQSTKVMEPIKPKIFIRRRYLNSTLLILKTRINWITRITVTVFWWNTACNRFTTVCNNLIRISLIRILSKIECKSGHGLLNKDDIAITTLLLAVNARSPYHILMQYPTALKLRINECNLLRSIHNPSKWPKFFIV